MSVNNTIAFQQSIRLPLSICVMTIAFLLAPVIAVAYESPNSEPATTMSMQPVVASNMKTKQGISMTGDVDYDFAVNMRTHHQMALNMSQAQLKNGKDASIHFANKIIAAQRKEIRVLDHWIAAHDKARTQ